MKQFPALTLLLPLMAAAQSGSTTVTSRVSALLAPSGGTQGLYLKQVGGPVLANQQERFSFQPGNAAAIVPLLYGVRLGQSGALPFDSQVTHLENPADGCPNPSYP